VEFQWLLQIGRGLALAVNASLIRLVVNPRVLLTAAAMTAFAANSLLCRFALKHTTIDAGTFTSVRIVSGALVLWMLMRCRGNRLQGSGDWKSASALFVYAIAFSYAYVGLSAATGALLLFGAVQITMIGYGHLRGERFSPAQLFGFIAATVGVLLLIVPGVTAPPLLSAALMLSAGIAWGIYSLRGRGRGDPVAVTAGNFVRAVPLALIASAVALDHAVFDFAGLGLAVASGAVASGVGYAIWYTALPRLTASTAATVQLSVPIIAALGGVLFLSEALTLRLLIASIAVLGGVALVLHSHSQPR
jgi:drug/metabolite transporter (DMT)-like permease